jgi:hypothetical protein
MKRAANRDAGTDTASHSTAIAITEAPLALDENRRADRTCALVSDLDGARQALIRGRHMPRAKLPATLRLSSRLRVIALPAAFHVIHIRDFLRSAVTGVIDLELSRHVLHEMAVRANVSGTPRIMIDLRETDAGMSLSDAVELAGSLGHLGLTAGTRIAVLMPDDGDRLKRGLYFQALASGQGYDVRPFLDFESASEWLSS